VPKGSPAILINSLRDNYLVQDSGLAKRNATKLDEKYAGILTPARLAELKAGLDRLWPDFELSRGQVTFDITQQNRAAFIQSFYSNVLGRVENSGHTFGTNLSDDEKKALIAFLATL